MDIDDYSADIISSHFKNNKTINEIELEVENTFLTISETISQQPISETISWRQPISEEPVSSEPISWWQPILEEPISWEPTPMDIDMSFYQSDPVVPVQQSPPKEQPLKKEPQQRVIASEEVSGKKKRL